MAEIPFRLFYYYYYYAPIVIIFECFCFHYCQEMTSTPSHLIKDDILQQFFRLGFNLMKLLLSLINSAEGDFVERGRDGVAHVTGFQLVLSVRICRRRASSLPPEVSLLSPHIINGYDVMALNYTGAGGKSISLIGGHQIFGRRRVSFSSFPTLLLSPFPSKC